ncbi:MAG: NAD-dependent epimerase/dehydratase family protein [Phycisphaeraceae bacterium]|nr:NAD-dependent epimerase/dehydratase family protein [Phycisphaeraceae bacterium]
MVKASCFSDSRVLITGGLGFIGSNLAIRLVELGAKVTVIDSLVPQYGGNQANIADIADKLTVNISDVRDSHSMQHLVQGQDYLFNLAGQTSHMDSMHDPFTDLEINCKAQLSILEACRHHNPDIRLVYASTRQFYGKPQYLPVDEKHTLKPVDINGIHKLAGEWYHSLYSQVYDMNACSLRLTNTYGPRMRIKDARQTFVGIWIRLILESKAFEVWEGHQKRDFTYVDDAVQAMLLAASHDDATGQSFNLGGLEIVSLNELADILIQAHGSGEVVHKSYPEDRKRIDIGDYYADDKLIRSTLGWQPQIKLLEGLKLTLDYYRDRMTDYL